MNYLLHLIYFLFLFISFSVNADTLGVRITGGVWSTEHRGFVSDSNSNVESINLKDDLNFKKNIQPFFYIYFEQPNKSLPNFRIGRTKLNSTSSNTLSKTITFKGTNYLVNEKIFVELNLEHIEAALYWKLFDNDNHLDLGLNFKEFAGKVTFSGLSSKVSEPFTATIPMIYTAYEVDLPLTALTFGINGSYLDIGKASLSDILIFIRFKKYYNIGVEAGYRSFQLRFDENLIKTDIKITGFFLNGFIYF